MLSPWSWMAEAVMMVLLLGTMLMAIRLDRALRVVRRDRASFEALITNLSNATGAVKLGIQALRGEAERAAEQIERRSEEADRMATDLSFLIEAAERACNRLEGQTQALDEAPPRRRRVRAAAAAAPLAPEPDLGLEDVVVDDDDAARGPRRAVRARSAVAAP